MNLLSINIYIKNYNKVDIYICNVYGCILLIYKQYFNINEKIFEYFIIYYIEYFIILSYKIRSISC